MLIINLIWKKLLINHQIKKTLIGFLFCITSSLCIADSKIVLSLTSDPKTLNPMVAKEATSSMVLSHVFEALTKIDGVTTKIKPLLAQSWQVNEAGDQWIFNLREDVRWFDGTPFTAEDVVFTFNEIIYNPQIDTSIRDILTIDGEMIQCQKIDSNQVVFNLPKPYAPFLMLIAGVDILPKHLLTTVVANNQFNSYWSVATQPHSIVGTGPYQVDRYQSGEYLVLKKNENYWRKDSKGVSYPKLDYIYYQIVPNNDVALLKFQQKEIDVLSLRGQDYPILKPNEEKELFSIYETGPQFGTNFIVLNQNPNREMTQLQKNKLHWFQNVNFRKAISFSIDRESIIDILMYGFGYPQYSPISPAATNFYNPNTIHYDYDIKQAKNILMKAGFSWNKSGQLLDENQNKVQFSMLTNSDNTVRLQMADMIRKDLEQIGIHLDIVPLEFNNLVNKLNVTFDWDAILIGLTGGIEPHFGKNIWHSTSRMHLWNPNQETPLTDWEKRIDDIFDRAVSELDELKRKKYYNEFQYIVSDQLPVIYTVLSVQLIAVRNKYGGIKPSPYGGVLHNIDEWFVI